MLSGTVCCSLLRSPLCGLPISVLHSDVYVVYLKCYRTFGVFSVVIRLHPKGGERDGDHSAWRRIHLHVVRFIEPFSFFVFALFLFGQVVHSTRLTPQHAARY